MINSGNQFLVSARKEGCDQDTCSYINSRYPAKVGIRYPTEIEDLKIKTGNPQRIDHHKSTTTVYTVYMWRIAQFSETATKYKSCITIKC